LGGARGVGPRGSARGWAGDLPPPPPPQGGEGGWLKFESVFLRCQEKKCAVFHAGNKSKMPNETFSQKSLSQDLPAHHAAQKSDES